MQLSLYTLLTHDLTIEDSVRVAAEAKFDAVDIRQHQDGSHLAMDVGDDEARRVAGLVADVGLHVSGLTTYHVLGAPTSELAALRTSMHTAQLLGARFIRVSGPEIDYTLGYEAIRELFRQQAAEASSMARDHGLIITMEQHGGRLSASAGQVLDLLRGVADNNLGVVYDPGNCVREGFERPLVQVEMLRHVMKAVHVKNAMTMSAEAASHMIPAENTRLDEGLLDWREIITAIKATGYDNYLTLEDFYDFDSVPEKLAWDVEYLRGLTR
jgi:sugar phosphate isomerase/epimerase